MRRKNKEEDRDDDDDEAAVQVQDFGLARRGEDVDTWSSSSVFLSCCARERVKKPHNDHTTHRRTMDGSLV